MHPKNKFGFLILALALTVTLLATACAAKESAIAAEHSINGRTAGTMFSDPGLAGLARSACDGDAAGVETSIRSGANPNGAGQDGFTPLAWAINCENLAGIEQLLAAGANPNQDMNGYSPVYVALYTKNPSVLKLLLKSGADINYVSPRSQDSLLGEAFDVGDQTGNWVPFDTLLAAGADINREDIVQRTVATKAALHGRFVRSLKFSKEVTTTISRIWRALPTELLRLLIKNLFA